MTVSASMSSRLRSLELSFIPFYFNSPNNTGLLLPCRASLSTTIQACWYLRVLILTKGHSFHRMQPLYAILQIANLHNTFLKHSTQHIEGSNLKSINRSSWIETFNQSYHISIIKSVIFFTNRRGHIRLCMTCACAACGNTVMQTYKRTCTYAFTHTHTLAHTYL